MKIPDDLQYTEEHVWAKPDADGLWTVGITDHAQDQLGDVVFVQNPEVGGRVTRGEACGVIESVKTAADVHAPLTGEVVELNAALADEPEQVNADPYAAWLFRMKPDDPAESGHLLDAAAYRAIEGADRD